MKQMQMMITAACGAICTQRIDDCGEEVTGVFTTTGQEILMLTNIFQSYFVAFHCLFNFQSSNTCYSLPFPF